MIYKYCSICGCKLKQDKRGHLACTRCPFVNYQNPRSTVTALVRRRGKLLLTKRARPPYQGWWDLPGGFMNKNETPASAVVRELREETGLKISLKKIFGIYPGTYPSKFDPFYVLSIVYLAASGSGKLLARDDVVESRWFGRRELPGKIAFDSNQKIIKDFLRIWK